VLQCVAVRCSVLVCFSVLQCVTYLAQSAIFAKIKIQRTKGNVLQCVAVCCSVLQCVAVCHVLRSVGDIRKSQRAKGSVLQCVAVCCRVLQGVAVCCSVSLIGLNRQYSEKASALLHLP